MPAARSNSSIAKCGVEPLPGVPKLITPGLALACATSPAIDVRSPCAPVAMTTGTRPTSETGVRSRSGSKGAGW